MCSRYAGMICTSWDYWNYFRGLKYPLVTISSLTHLHASWSRCLVDWCRLFTSRSCLGEGDWTNQSALDGLELSLSRKVEKSTLIFCEFYLLGFYFYPKTCQRWFWRLALLASVVCALVPCTRWTLWWYTPVCTKVTFTWYPVQCCLTSFDILRGCALLTLCGLMPSSVIVRRQGLL